MDLMDADYDALLEQERAEYDDRYARVDIDAPLEVAIDPRERWLWDHYVGSVAGKHVLEVGSGDGRMTCWLANLGARVSAIELSPVGVARTQERARLYHLEERVSAFCEDACRLGSVLPPDSVDIALGFSVLHHLPAREFGRSLRMVLKPGGRAVFFENSNANPFYRLARRIRNSETACGSPLTREEARALIDEVGHGELVYPRFGFFELTKKYIFRNNTKFSFVVASLDNAIDHIPGVRAWSAHMWVVARK